MRVCNDQCSASWLASRLGGCNVAIFLDTIAVINVKLGMVVSELYLSVPLSLNLTRFQGHTHSSMEVLTES